MVTSSFVLKASPHSFICDIQALARLGSVPPTHVVDPYPQCLHSNGLPIWLAVPDGGERYDSRTSSGSVNALPGIKFDLMRC